MTKSRLWDHFTSNGMKMRGNLRTKTAELIDKVKTNYEIQNQNQLRNLLIGQLSLVASAPVGAEIQTPASRSARLAQAVAGYAKQRQHFTDNVVIKQGTIDIRADKVVVTSSGRRSE